MDSLPSTGPGFAGLWGGQGFGGLGSPGAVPPQPAAMPGGPQQPPIPYTGPGVNPALYPGGQQQPTPTYTGPGVNPALYPGTVQSTGPSQLPQQGNLWDALMKVVGQGGMPKMPGTTVGAPAGASGAMAPPATPVVAPGQMGRPPGIPYFNQGGLQNPAGNAGLMGQYLALQQLMRGS